MSPSRGEPGFDLLCIGESMVVLSPAAGGSLHDAGQLTVGVGGAESNVALHAADQGLRVAWASRLGADPFGDRIVDELTTRGVDTHLVVRDHRAATGLCLKGRNPDGTTEVVYYRSGSAASLLSPDDAATWPIHLTARVHVSGITAALSATSIAMLESLFARAAELDIPVSFDVNFRPSLWGERDAAAILLDLANLADLVFVGRDEAELLWGTPTVEQIDARLTVPRRIVVKDGDVEAVEIDRTTGRSVITRVPTPPADVIELVGAGDAFAAGYLTGLALGEDAETRLRRGHHVAAWTIGSWDDARPGIPLLPPDRPVGVVLP